MKKLKLIVSGVCFFAASAAYAECPSELPEAMLMDCIVYEGSGDFEAATEVVEEWKESQKAKKQETAGDKEKLSFLN